jgi:hypothetical protein
LPVSILKEKQIKSARTRTSDDIHRQLSAELLVLMDHVKGNPQQKLHHAKKILAALLQTHGYNLARLNPKIQKFAMRVAAEVIDSPTRSVTHTTAAPNAKNVPDTTAKTQSTYQTKLECLVKAKNDEGLSDEGAEIFCSQYFGEQKGTKQGQYSPADCSKYLTSQGLSQDQASKACAEILGNHETKGAAERILVRSASIQDADVPAYVYLSGQEYVDNYKRMMLSNNNNIKSGSVSSVPANYFDMDAAYSLQRQSAARIERIRGINESALRSASDSNKKPAWLRASEAFWGTVT